MEDPGPGNVTMVTVTTTESVNGIYCLDLKLQLSVHQWAKFNKKYINVFGLILAIFTLFLTNL